ncbi:hypothetical protein RDI58_010670 [Solanum bulbocastanum]|uniref:Uncharacterized protein n=1 Tax=Solanum bulbocastanum TaxID=147425 RepID=A0AAN8YFL3_SOLBU
MIEKVQHQREFESLHRDLIVGLEIGTLIRRISNSLFPDNEGSKRSSLGFNIMILLKPPPPNVCGSPGGLPVTSPRVQLSDGRYVTYKESGVAKEMAKHKISIVHGFDSSKDLML